MKGTKEYRELVPNEKATHIEIEIYYSKGGANYFTGQNEQRGIYVSVSPVTLGENFVSYTAFTGIKQLIKPMARFSQKVLNETNVDATELNELIEHVCQKNGIKLKSVE
ncbi:MAG: hypothetical protein KatS3mg035_1069 [Bacteroidia bacterium]|nr:MAG: hypothetical protein KatS3mg035_1069 [Bacteroidia bacterium]